MVVLSWLYAWCAFYPAFSIQRVVSILNENHGRRYSRVQRARCARILQGYARDLKNIPGARKIIETLQNMYKSGDIENMQGHLFELEVAAWLQSIGTSIYALSEHIGDYRCEFDILTPTRLIECKNVNMRHSSRLHDQILRQKAIADGLKKKYVVYFKKPISVGLQQWFRDHSIAYRIFKAPA